MTTKAVPLHELGKDGPSIPPMGFGLMTIAGAHGDQPSDEEHFNILDRALELGDTFWDTAEYASEQVALGERSSSIAASTETI